MAAAALAVGGSLFAAGAAVAQVGSGDATTAASIYFAGGTVLHLNTGAYASLLGAINAPWGVAAGRALNAERWHWWSYEPHRIDWLNTFVLLVGTLAFAVNLTDSLLDGLTTQQVNRLIWAVGRRAVSDRGGISRRPRPATASGLASCGEISAGRSM